MAVTEVEVRARTGAERWVVGNYAEPVLIPKERYTDPAFLQLEFDRLWPRVWQMACHQDEVREVGDYVEYTIGDQSILVVRTSADAIKGFYNACLHRGRLLKEGCGSVREIRCGFHSWRWNLDGTIKEVVDADTFHPDMVNPMELCLPEVLVDTWAGFVFINFDHDAMPLREFMGHLPAQTDPGLPEDMGVYSIRTFPVDCNWKVAWEAFAEAYHVQGTHQQMLWYMDDSSFRQSPEGDGRYRMGGSYDEISNLQGSPPRSEFEIGAEMTARRGTSRTYSQRLGSDLDVDSREALYLSVRDLAQGDIMYQPSDVALADAMRHEELPEGMNEQAAFAMRQLEQMQAEGIRVPPQYSPGVQSFPNLMGPWSLRAGCTFRFRPHPTDPDKSLWDIYHLRRYPLGKRPEIKREVLDVALSGDDEHDVEYYGRIFYQDLENCPYVQKGLHIRSLAGLRPGWVQESALRSFHRAMDLFLSRNGNAVSGNTAEG